MPLSEQQVTKVSLSALRDGCAHVRERLRAHDLPTSTIVSLAEDHLHAIEHELRFAEECPLSMFKDRQCHRLSTQCKDAAKALANLSTNPTTPKDRMVADTLSVAFLALIPCLLEDYETALKHKLRIHCH